jgi:DinB family protein
MSLTDPAAILEACRRELERLPAFLATLVGDLDDDTARRRPAAGEWAPVEIACHLRDEEVEDFGARLRAVLDGADRFAPIDPERWAVERRYLDERLSEVLSELLKRRRSTLELLAGIDPARLTNAVLHRSGAQLTGLDLLVAWVTHDRLHAHQLTGTLARLWANRWSPLRVEYAGPIPYPPASS